MDSCAVPLTVSRQMAQVNLAFLHLVQLRLDLSFDEAGNMEPRETVDSQVGQTGANCKPR